MKVLHVITGLATGGTESALAALLQASDRARLEHFVLSLTGTGTIARRIERLGIPVFELRLHEGVRWRNLRGALRFVRAAQPGVVQGWMYHGNLAAALIRAIVHRSARLVWNVRQCIYDLGAEKRLTRWVIRACARISGAADRLIYNSALSRMQHERLGFRAESALVLHNGFDGDRFRPAEPVRQATREQLGFGPDDLVVGMVGRFHPVKDHETFLRACAAVATRLPAARFLVAGPECGPANATLRDWVAQHGLTSRLLLLDEWTATEALYPALDVLCLTSRAEGFPNVLGEAMLCAVPCVSTDVGDCAMLLGDDADRLAPPGRADLLAQRIVSLLGLEPTTRRRLGEAGREHILRTFSIGAVAQRYDNLLSVSGQ